MADEKKEGEMPEPQEPEQTPASATPAVVDPAEFAKLQAALKQANKESAERRKKLEAFEKEEQARKDAALSDAEKASQRLQEYEAKLRLLERRELVRKVADEVGLPLALAERLQGETEEELKADAEKLLALVPAPDKPKLKTDPTNPGNAHREESEAEMRARLFPNNANPFDPKAMRARGGGLVFNDKE